MRYFLHLLKARDGKLRSIIYTASALMWHLKDECWTVKEALHNEHDAMQHVWKPKTAPWDMYTRTICQSHWVADWVCRIPLTSSGLKNGNDALAEDAEWLEKKLRVCGMQLWTRINEQDKVIPAQSFYLFHLCNPVSWCVLMCPTHDSEALRLRTESLECLNLKIESERRDVGMLRIPGFSLKSV